MGHKGNRGVKLIQVSIRTGERDVGEGTGGGKRREEAGSHLAGSLTLIPLKSSRLAELQSGRTGQPDVSASATLPEQCSVSLTWL